MFASFAQKGINTTSVYP